MVDTTALGEERSRFLTDHMNPVLHDLVTDVICHQPEDPLKFMQSWLQKRLGRTSDYAIEATRLKTIARDAQVEALKKENGALWQELAVMGQKLTEGHAFVTGDGEEGAGGSAVSSAAEETLATSEGEVAGQDDAAPVPRTRALAVSAEAFGSVNPKTAVVPPVIPKDEQTMQNLREILAQSFLWQGLESEGAKLVLLNALEDVSAAPGRELYAEGDEADCMYIVAEGRLDCWKKTDEEMVAKQEDEHVEDEDDSTKPDPSLGRLLRTVEPGLMLGENALLHPGKRACTVVAKEECVLYRLDRSVFHAVLHEAAAKRKKTLERFLRQVPLFGSLDDLEITRLVDGLKLQTFEEKAVLSEQGSEGKQFFLVKSGQLSGRNGERFVIEHGVVAREYAEGDFWGELALVFDHPRPATVRVFSAFAEVYVLSRQDFVRLVGNMTDVLGRNVTLHQFP